MSSKYTCCYYCDENNNKMIKTHGYCKSRILNYINCKEHYPENSKQTESFGECLYCLHENEKLNIKQKNISSYFDCKKHNSRWR